MNYKPTDAEIDAAANEIAICHGGRPLEKASALDRLDYKTAAIKALIAADKAREVSSRTSQKND